MKRPLLILIPLVAVVLIVVSFMFLIRPQMDQAAELRVEAEDLRTQQQQVRSQITALARVRETSPTIEAELAAISAIIPQDPALPSALRQFQMAAQDSGVTINSMSPSAPTSANISEAPNLASISWSLSIEGGYFQVVDFLRRLEDPVVTPRGVLVRSVTASPGELPTLSVSVSVVMFADLQQVPTDAPPDEPPADDADDADDDDDENGEEDE
jgi:Tfp pilus assembly protein PilO